MVKELLIIAVSLLPRITPDGGGVKCVKKFFSFHTSPQNFHIIPFFPPHSFKRGTAGRDCSVPSRTQSSRRGEAEDLTTAMRNLLLEPFSTIYL